MSIMTLLVLLNVSHTVTFYKLAVASQRRGPNLKNVHSVFLKMILLVLLSHFKYQKNFQGYH